MDSSMHNFESGDGNIRKNNNSPIPPTQSDHQLNAAVSQNQDENLPLTAKGPSTNSKSDIKTVVNAKEDACPNTAQVDYSPPIICCCRYKNNQFYRGCLWSPDILGNRILTCDGNSHLRIYHSFLNKLDYTSSQFSKDVLEVRNVGRIFDYNWYPVLSPSDYYIMVASSLGPLHIYDLSSRKCIASYQMFNTKDEMVHANCLACFPDGSRILGATKDYIFLFDVNQPGRTYERISSRRYFKKGILSAITVNPGRYSMFAVGSYNSHIGIYDENDFLCLLNGHDKGITHLKFSSNGLLLYSGCRGSGEMICWDLRNPGTALYKLERVVKTQQKIYFDMTPDSRYIFSGSTDGDIYIWDTSLPPCNSLLSPVNKFKAHDDCVNGIGVHPKLPFIITSSGQYHDTRLSSILSQYGSDSEEEIIKPIVPADFSLKLWRINMKWS